MADTYDLILKGGTVVNHDGEGARDLGIRGGRFRAIGDLSRASAGEVIDCRGLHLLPGQESLADRPTGVPDAPPPPDVPSGT